MALYCRPRCNRACAGLLPTYRPNELIVALVKPVSPAWLHKAIGGASLQASVRGIQNNTYMVIAFPSANRNLIRQRLKALAAVRYVQPNYIYRGSTVVDEPNDPLFIDQWHLAMIELPEAWQDSDGAGVTVAVVDSGVHPGGRDGFGDRLLRGYNAFIHKPWWWHDQHGHGTHVAGTIAQETNNGIGCAGIAHAAYILPVKALDRNNAGTTETIAEGVRWAADNGADIINLSVGADGPLSDNGDRVLHEAVTYAYNKSITLVAAAGNSNTSKSEMSLSYPAAYAEVFSVGAVDRNGLWVDYSNGGLTLWLPLVVWGT